MGRPPNEAGKENISRVLGRGRRRTDTDDGKRSKFPHAPVDSLRVLFLLVISLVFRVLLVLRLSMEVEVEMNL